MRLHTIQHVGYEDLGTIGSWAESRGFTLSTTRPFAGDAYPPPESADWHVVLGGPMGACDEADHAWLAAEKRWLRAVIDAQVPLLAICLGAQLVAHVLGAEVRRAAHPEIGWHPIAPEPGRADSELEPFFAPGVEVLQWHYDTFALPVGAERLAHSAGCAEQGFGWGASVYALQFHPEMTAEHVAAILEREGSLPEGPWVSARERLLEPERFERLELATHGFLDRLRERW